MAFGTGSDAISDCTGNGGRRLSCPASSEHSFNRLQDDVPQDLCQYKGKVALVVNTASYCGFTKQYEGLEKPMPVCRIGAGDSGFPVK
jgi:hypothetical protein